MVRYQVQLLTLYAENYFFGTGKWVVVLAQMGQPLEGTLIPLPL